MTVLLEMRNIRKTFPGVVALDRVDLRIGAGEIHALVGENGGGEPAQRLGRGQAGELGALGEVDEAVLASGLDASKTWIRESIQLQRQLVASVISTHGPIESLPFTPVADFGADVLAAVDAVAGLEGYALWHASRAVLLRRLGRDTEAADADGRAVALGLNEPQRRRLGS